MRFGGRNEGAVSSPLHSGRGPGLLYYQRRGVENWEGYEGRRFDDHHELLLTSTGLRGRTEGPRAWREASYQRKRRESARVHERLAAWLLINHDHGSKRVGIWDHQAGALRDARFSEIADRVGCNVFALKDAFRRFWRNGWIHRHQPRDFDPTAARPFTGKVAELYITTDFLIASRCKGLREDMIKRRKARDEKRAAQAAQRAALGELAHELANLKGGPSLWERFERKVMAEHPDWVLGREFTRIQDATRALVDAHRDRPPPR